PCRHAGQPNHGFRTRQRGLAAPFPYQLTDLVGVAGFEPTTTCPPDRCATSLRYTPKDQSRLATTGTYSAPSRFWSIRPPSSAQQLQHFLQLHPHLPDDLGAERGLLAPRVALQAQPGAADGVALLVQQAADLAHHQHLVALVVAAVAPALDRVEHRELGFPVAQHVRLDVAQLADLADGEVALGRDRRKLAVAARVKHVRLH